jgi:hypothetical protein
LRNGHPIYGATNAAYTSESSDIGTQLSVRVASSEFGYATDYATADVPGVITDSNTQPTMVEPPAIQSAGGFNVGTVLHATPGTWSVAGMSYTYQWFEGTTSLGDATNEYTVNDADLGQQITVQVVASKTGYPTTAPVVSAPVTPVVGAALTPNAPFSFSSSTKGLAKGFIKYTVNPGSWSGPGASFSYVWAGDTSDIIGSADAQSVVVSTSKAALVDPLTITVTASAQGFVDSLPTTATARKGASPLTPLTSPIVSVGTSAQSSASTIDNGSTATVTTGEWTPNDPAVSVTYQWYRALPKKTATAIAGATSSSYSPVIGDIAHALSVKVSAHSSEWPTASITVAAGTVVPSSAFAADEPDVYISGDRTPGDPLFVDNLIDWAGDAATYVGAWYECAPTKCATNAPLSSYTKLSGTNGTEFSPTAANAGENVIFVYTASEPGYATVVDMSPPVTILAADIIPVDSGPSYNLGITTQSGDPAGQALGSFASFGQFPNVTYAWQECDADCLTDGATWTAMTSGGSSQTYTPTGAQVGDYVRVVITASRNGYATVTLTGAEIPVTEGSLVNVIGYPKYTGSLADGYGLNLGTLPAYVTASPHWVVNGVEVSTDNTYTVDPDDAGGTYYVAIVYSASGFADYTKVLPINVDIELPTQPVSITGTTYGDTMTVSPALPWDLPELPYVTWTVEYEWITGTGETMTDVPSYQTQWRDAGYPITVKVLAESDLTPYGVGVPIPSATTPADILPAAAPVPDQAPVMQWSGDLAPGTLVTVPAPTFSMTASSSQSVQVDWWWETSPDGTTWTRTDEEESSNTFTPSLTEAELYLRVVEYGTAFGHTTYVGDTPTVQIGAGTPVRDLQAPTVSSSAQVGVPVAVDSGVWSAGSTTHIQWMLNGHPIAGATSATYTPVATNAGDELSAEITGTEPGELDVAVDSNDVTIADGAAPVATKQPVVSGTTVLSVTTGTWNVSGLTFTYQWQDSDSSVVMVNNTASTYTLQPGEVSANVTVTVTATRFGYEPGSDTVPK